MIDWLKFADNYNSTQKAPFSIKTCRRNQLDEIYMSTVSKPDLKHSGALFRKSACDLGFADTIVPVDLGLLPTEGD